MAVQPLIGRMQHEPPGAARAACVPAAGFARKDRRIPAPIDEHQALLAPRQAGADRREHRRAKALLSRLVAQIDGTHHGQPGTGRGALVERDSRVAALAEVVPALERRRRAAQHHRAGGELRSIDGRIACRISQAFLLLEGAVVLFVDHDERKLGQGREHRQARAENDAGIAACGSQPCRSACHVLEPAVHQGKLGFGKRFPEAAFELWRQADLGNQHERLPAAFQHARDEMEIDLGLAASGDAVQEHRREAAEVRCDGVYRAGLVGGQLMNPHKPRRARLRLASERLARQRLERTQARWQRGDDGFAERTLVVRRKEVHQLEPLAREARRVAAHIDDGLESIESELARGFRLDHHAGLIAVTERHRDAVA